MGRRKRYRKKSTGGAPILLLILVAILPQVDTIVDILMPIFTILFLTGIYFLFGKPIAAYLNKHRYLSSNIEDVDDLTGHQFEHFLAPLFERQGYRAEVTKGSGEYGADLILKRKGQRSIVQAKCYGEGKKVGVKAVQEVVGALAMYKATKGIVATNRYFTRQAENLARVNNVKLIDRDELAQLMYRYGERPVRAEVILNED